MHQHKRNSSVCSNCTVSRLYVILSVISVCRWVNALICRQYVQFDPVNFIPAVPSVMPNIFVTVSSHLSITIWYHITRRQCQQDMLWPLMVAESYGHLWLWLSVTAADVTVASDVSHPCVLHEWLVSLSVHVSSTVKLRIEAPGFYQYKWMNQTPGLYAGPASIRDLASVTCQLCVILFKNHQPLCTSTSNFF